MKKFALAALAAILLAGCQTTTPEAQIAANQGKCTGYGFSPGTDAFAACMMQMDRDYAEANRRAQQALGQSMQELGESMQRQNQTVTCNTYGNAGYSTTTCR